MSNKKLIKRLISPIREFGVLAGCLYLLDRVFRRLSGNFRVFVYEIMVQPVATVPLLPARLAKAFSYRRIYENDSELRAMPIPFDVIKYRYNQGAMCLGIFKNKDLIGYIWFCRGLYQEDEVRCSFYMASSRSAVFDFDLYIYPKHRFGVAFAALWEGANKFLSDQGIEYTFSRVTRFNLSSLRSHRRLGSRSIGKAIFLRIFVWEILFSSVFPYFSLSVSRAQRIKIHLNM